MNFLVTRKKLVNDHPVISWHHVTMGTPDCQHLSFTINKKATAKKLGDQVPIGR